MEHINSLIIYIHFLLFEALMAVFYCLEMQVILFCKLKEKKAKGIGQSGYQVWFLLSMHLDAL